MLSVFFHTLEFLAYHLIISVVDRVSRLPRNSTPPEMMRLLRENIALKSQVRALVLELKAVKGKKPRVSMRTRAAQVLAYLLTRGDKSFTRYYLSASMPTLRNWATRFRRGPWPWRKNRGGRPPLAKEVAEIIVTLKKENGSWGAKRIQDELRRMGIKVSQPTIQKVLREHGFDPLRGGGARSWERFKSSAKDAVWALDFLAVQLARGTWVQVLLVIDLYTRELIELRAAEGWAVDSVWTVRTFADAMRREGRRPGAVVHDRGSQFAGQFKRQLRVLEVEQRRAPPYLPFVNGVAERAVKSVRLDILNHVRCLDIGELQWYLDEYRTYYGQHRAHQAIDGETPAAFGQDAARAEVISLDEVRRRRLVRRSFAHGLLNAYELVDEEAAAA